MRHRNQETALSTPFKGDAGCCIDTRLERGDSGGGLGGGGSGWSYQVNGACPLVVMVHGLEARIFLLPLSFPFKDEIGKPYSV